MCSVYGSGDKRFTVPLLCYAVLCLGKVQCKYLPSKQLLVSDWKGHAMSALTFAILHPLAHATWSWGYEGKRKRGREGGSQGRKGGGGGGRKGGALVNEHLKPQIQYWPHTASLTA